MLNPDFLYDMHMDDLGGDYHLSFKVKRHSLVYPLRSITLEFSFWLLGNENYYSTSKGIQVNIHEPGQTHTASFHTRFEAARHLSERFCTIFGFPTQDQIK